VTRILGDKSIFDGDDFEATAEKSSEEEMRRFSRQEWKELAQSPSRNVKPLALNQWLRSRLVNVLEQSESYLHRRSRSVYPRMKRR
jgi:hypothetical protein